MTKISENAELIVKEAAGKVLLNSRTDLHTTREYTAIVRDLNYCLNYANYAMLSEDTSILNDRLLNYTFTSDLSLSVRALKEVVPHYINPEVFKEFKIYLDYIVSSSNYQERKTQRDVENNIWERGDRAIAIAAGGAVLGGLIAQVPGSIIGGIAGALFGFLVPSKKPAPVLN